MTFVSIIIPTFNDDDRLQICIRALHEQNFCKGKFEVIIVNNSENPVLVPLPGSNFKVLTESKPGSYAARNCGLLNAKGDILVFTDSDCIPKSDWLENGVNSILIDKVDRVAGRVEIVPQKKKMTAVECYEKIFAFDQRKNASAGTSVTANLFVKKYVFEKIGGFRSDLFSGGDMEWNIRASKIGFSILYSKEAVVQHPARRTWSELERKIRRTTGGRYLIDQGYNLSLLRSIFPPIEAGSKILKSNEPFRTKIYAFLVAYRIKLEKFFYLKKLKSGKVAPSRT